METASTPVSLEGAARGMGVQLSTEQVECFRRYYEELEGWNRRVNLTSVTGWEEVRETHFLDSLSVVQVLPGGPGFSGTLADVGSGGGFPGIPLRLAVPQLGLTLLEAVQKKAAFLLHLAGVLGLEDVQMVARRAEEAGRVEGFRERFDVVVSRAVGSLATVSELCLPLCRTGGLVVVQKKGEISWEMERGVAAAEELGGELGEVRRVDALPGERVLVVLRKRRATPGRYPRRPGIPAKRPLGRPERGGLER